MSRIDPETTLFNAIVREHVDPRIALCESPIERLFALAFIALTGTRLVEEHSTNQPGLFLAREASSGMQPEWPGDENFVKAFAENMGCFAYCQFPVKLDGRTFRLDFAILPISGGRYAVELDGHSFHERTKDQAKRDKSRDRRLAAAGWSVLRFTGSEVWADALGCAYQALDIINSRTEQDA